MSYWAIFIHSLQLIKRSRFLSFSLLVLILVISGMLLAAQFSGRQPVTVALDVGLSILRLCMPFLIALQVQEMVSREFERRYYLTSMTYPHTRSSWLMGRFIALFLAICVLLVLLATAISAVSLLIASGYSQSTPVSLGAYFWLTVFFVGVDLLTITSVALFLAVIASTPGFVLIGTLGFTLVSRSYTTVIDLLNQQYGLVQHQDSYKAGLGSLQYVLPDLGALDIRAMALYNTGHFFPENWHTLISSCLIYSTIFILLALWSLQRKQLA